ncbi:hypothetical protein Tco_0403512 [Tanacetum coccineum]
MPPDHVDDLPVVEPNQHDDVLAIPEPVLVDEDEDPKEEEFEEEEEPQEEEDGMEVDIEEDVNEPKLKYPYEEVDPLNPPPAASKSEPEDVIEVEEMVEPEDEIVPASVHEVGTSTLFLVRWLLFRDDCVVARRRMVEKKGKAKDKYYGKLTLDLGNEVRFSVEEGMSAMENLNERVEKDLYWTRVRAHEFYREMIRRGFVFEERPNEAINVSVKDGKSPSSEPRGSLRDS